MRGVYFLTVKALGGGGNGIFHNFCSFIRYLVENFLCFPMVYNIPGTIVDGFQVIRPEVQVGRGSSADLPI